jgi:hypothetical protein
MKCRNCMVALSMVLFLLPTMRAVGEEIGLQCVQSLPAAPDGKGRFVVVYLDTTEKRAMLRMDTKAESHSHKLRVSEQEYGIYEESCYASTKWLKKETHCSRDPVANIDRMTGTLSIATTIADQWDFIRNFKCKPLEGGASLAKKWITKGVKQKF